MRKINKLAAAIAVAVGVGAASTANAVIELKPNGLGDALLFPIYHSYLENYFTISNKDTNRWIQGHLRFRGAAWSGELLDFDVILSPGDVLVFRLADLNGDGQWEIDQTIEEGANPDGTWTNDFPCPNGSDAGINRRNNFRYTGMWASGNMPFTCKDTDGTTPLVGCMKMSQGLVPSPSGTVTQDIINYHLAAGYVEFIGEATLDGMNHPTMDQLVCPGTPAPNPVLNYRTKVFNKLGTTAWIWSDADGGRSGSAWGDDQGLSDVPNVLSGNAFLTITGQSQGLAYNAEALVNFRTATCGGDSATAGDGPDNNGDGIEDGCEAYARGEHRIDNYRIGALDTYTGYNTALQARSWATFPASLGTKRSGSAYAHPQEGPDFNPLAENRAVIMHDENGVGAGGASPRGDYVYWWTTPETRCEEQSIAFNNTWGPTLADGDDYEMDRDFMTVAATSNEVPPQETGAVNANGEKGALRWTTLFPPALSPNLTGSNPFDDVDDTWTYEAYAGPFVTRNSVAEVDEAIRAAGDSFSTYYMDALAGDIFDKSGLATDGLITQFLSYFPTKFFYFEDLPNRDLGICRATGTNFSTLEAFVTNRVGAMMAVPKGVNVQIWDIKERELNVVDRPECISPATDPSCFTTTRGVALPFEVGIMGIDFLTRALGGPLEAPWDKGRVVFDLLDNGNAYLSRGSGVGPWAGLMYAFEWDKDNQFPFRIFTHWRSMQR